METLTQKIHNHIKAKQKRHRTLFYDDVDYSGWWIKSKIRKRKGKLLRNRPRTFKGKKINTYKLLFLDGIEGGKIWTISELEYCCWIRPRKKFP